MLENKSTGRYNQCFYVIIFLLFCFAQSVFFLWNLTHQKNTDVEKLLTDAGNKLTIVTGRAGTGKTVQLLQLAFLLANEDLLHQLNRLEQMDLREQPNLRHDHNNQLRFHIFY